MENMMLISPRRAAELGEPKAQLELAHMYAKGEGGVEQDFAEAAKWYRLVAEKGNAEAQNALGELYGNGDGVPEDPAEALKWIRLAANQGYAEALHNLGYVHGKGHGVKQDLERAHFFFDLAARLGYAPASDYRAKVAKKLRPAQVAETKRRARDWLDKHGRA